MKKEEGHPKKEMVLRSTSKSVDKSRRTRKGKGRGATGAGSKVNLGKRV